MLDQGQLKLNTATNLGDHLLIQTSPEGRQMIEFELKLMRSELDSVQMNASDNKTRLQKLLSDLTEFLKEHEILNMWIKEVRLKQKSDAGLKRDLAEKKIFLERMKVCFIFK